MKRFKLILLVIGLLFAGSANVMAQQRAEKTASARAYYGTTPSKPKLQKKHRQKVDWRTHSKPARGTHYLSRDSRRKLTKG
jgi:hypothetical protein